MQKNEVISNEESDVNDKRKEKLKKLFEYEETSENGKIVLVNKKVKLVQLTDCKEDREIYKTVTADYNTFCMENIHGVIRNSNLDELFNEEILHKNYEKFPLFACYNSRNELIGTFGSRNAIVVKNGNKEITLHELSGRLMKKYENSGIGSIADAVMGNYFTNNDQPFFFTGWSDKREYFMKVWNYVIKCYFLGSKQRYIDKTQSVDIGNQDFYCTVTFDGLFNQLS